MELKISMFKVVSYEGLVALCTNESHDLIHSVMV